jgi:hypothetical protein
VFEDPPPAPYLLQAPLTQEVKELFEKLRERLSRQQLAAALRGELFERYGKGIWCPFPKHSSEAPAERFGRGHQIPL